MGRYSVKYDYVTTPKGVADAMRRLEHKSLVGIDTETTGLDPLIDKILLIQVGDERKQYIFDVAKIGVPNLKPLLYWLPSETVLKIGHNMKFDYGMLKGNFGIDMKNVACTMIGEQLLNSGRNQRAGLAVVADKYLGVDMDKREQTSFIGMKWGQKFTANQLRYAAEDVALLPPLYSIIHGLLKDRGMEELSLLEFETVRVTADLELNGIYLNKEKWLALKDKAQTSADAARLELNKHFTPHCNLNLFGEPAINYDSPKQLQEKLSQILKMKLTSTARPVLDRLTHHDVIKSLLKYRSASKLVSTYGVEFLNKHVSEADGRVHSKFTQLADTGRYKSSEPNINNIPKEQEYRTPFQAQDPENYRIISADFSGQELRLLAQISKEPQFLYALEKHMDLHSYSASLIFDIPYEDFFEKDGNGDILMKNGEPEVKKDMKKKYRNPCKSITFGLIYGMGPKKLSETLKIDIKEAKELMAKYFRIFPKIKELMDSLTADARRRKYALSPLDGRRRDLSNVDWDNPKQVSGAMNQSKNLPFQGPQLKYFLLDNVPHL